jgi:integrase
MAKSAKKKLSVKNSPMLENGKVTSNGRNRKPLERRSAGTPGSPLSPSRQTNASRRKREYLAPDEVEKLLQASGKLGRHGARDRTLILLAYRHGLRGSVGARLGAALICGYGRRDFCVNYFALAAQTTWAPALAWRKPRCGVLCI